jgi:hypothetical protein
MIQEIPRMVIDKTNGLLEPVKPHTEDEEWEDIGEEIDVFETDTPNIEEPKEPHWLKKMTKNEARLFEAEVEEVEEIKSEESFTAEDLEALKAIQKEKPEAVNALLAQESAELD